MKRLMVSDTQVFLEPNDLHQSSSMVGTLMHYWWRWDKERNKVAAVASRLEYLHRPAD
jgi:hypothetical protein